MNDRRRRQLDTLHRLRKLEEDAAKGELASARKQQALADAAVRESDAALIALAAQRGTLTASGVVLDLTRLDALVAGGERLADERAARETVRQERESAAVGRADALDGAWRARRAVAAPLARAELAATRDADARALEASAEAWINCKEGGR